MALPIFNNIVESIREADSNGLLVENTVLSGFSGEKLIGFLQRLSLSHLHENECYLEVGVFQGLTLLSVAKAMKTGIAYGIDNFAYFDKEGKNYSIVKQRIKALDIENVSIINMDYEDALEQMENHIGEKKIGVYFVDGPHDYRSQLICLALVKPYLSDNAVIIVDDSNYPHVRQANRDFLVTNPEYKLVFEAYTSCHPSNMTEEEEAHARKGWWNGVNVIVRDSDNSLEAMYPPTLRSRVLFENEHLVHSMRHSEYAPQAVLLASSILSFNPIYTAVYFIRLIATSWKVQTKQNGKYRLMNTYSDNLPKSQFNAAVDNN